MTPIELATIASRVAQLSTQDRGAVARVLGVLRQTDMTDPRVRVAVDIVVAVRLSDHEGDTTLDAGDPPGGALPGDMIPSSGRVRDEVWATLDPKPAPLESRIREVYRELGLIGAIREYRNSTRTLDGVCSANLAESKAWVVRVCADESPAVTR